MMEELAFGAIRSRTWTSAGMMDIFKDKNAAAMPQEQLWPILQVHCGLPANLKLVQDFLKEHVIEIARDNLEGQCTEGHSCKLKSIEALQRLIDVQREGGNGKIPAVK